MVAISILARVVLGVAVQGDGGAIQSPAGAGVPARPEAATRIAEAELTSLGHGYARRGELICFDGVPIDQAGRETLEAFGRVLGRRLTLAHDVNAASFTALSEEHAKDKDTGYDKWISSGRSWVVEVAGADSATFEVMDFNLARDVTGVWRTDTRIEGAEAATAGVVNPGWAWKDRRAVCDQFTRLDGADPESFRHLDQGFSRDASQVYWRTTRLEGADASTSRTFGSDAPYAVDRERVWSGGTRLSSVDAGSFRLLHNHVLADRSGVSGGARALPVVGADPPTFRKVAELEGSGRVLFRDAVHDHLFDPRSGEVCTLTSSPQTVEVAKPVWLGGANGPVRRAATVSATWAGGAMSEPDVPMQPGFEHGAKPMWEVGKMQRMTDAIREALVLQEKPPVEAGAQESSPAQTRGGT